MFIIKSEECCEVALCGTGHGNHAGIVSEFHAGTCDSCCAAERDRHCHTVPIGGCDVDEDVGCVAWACSDRCSHGQGGILAGDADCGDGGRDAECYVVAGVSRAGEGAKGGC